MKLYDSLAHFVRVRRANRGKKLGVLCVLCERLEENRHYVE